MIITTTNQYNEINCCCNIPTSPEPIKECQTLEAQGTVFGFVNDNLPFEQWYDTLYHVYSQTYDNGAGHKFTYTYNIIYQLFLGGVQISDDMVQTISESGPNNFNNPILEGYAGATTFDDQVVIMKALANTKVEEAWDDEDYQKTDSCINRQIEDFDPTSATDMFVDFTRYRMKLPLDFPVGNYYELEWDEVFFPTAYDEWLYNKGTYELWQQCVANNPDEPEICGDEPPNPGPAPSEPTLLAERTWLSNGNAESEWFTMEPAPVGEDGEVRIVNLLASSWKSATLGQLPTSYGEIFEFT